MAKEIELGDLISIRPYFEVVGKSVAGDGTVWLEVIIKLKDKSVLGEKYNIETKHYLRIPASFCIHAPQPEDLEPKFHRN